MMKADKKTHTSAQMHTKKMTPKALDLLFVTVLLHTPHLTPPPPKKNNPPKPKIKHRIESPHKFNKKASEVWRLCLKRRVQSTHSIHFYDRNTQEDWTNMDTGIRVKVHRYTYQYHHYNNKRRYASTYTGKDFGCSDNKCPLSSPVSRMWTGLYAKSVVTSAGAGHALVSLQPIVHLLHMGAVAAVTRLKTQVHDVVIVYPPFESYIGAEAQWLPNYTQATAWKSFWRKLGDFFASIFNFFHCYISAWVEALSEWWHLLFAAGNCILSTALNGDRAVVMLMINAATVQEPLNFYCVQQRLMFSMSASSGAVSLIDIARWWPLLPSQRLIAMFLIN